MSSARTDPSVAPLGRDPNSSALLDLVGRLRIRYESTDKPVAQKINIMIRERKEAADRIEALEAEVARQLRRGDNHWETLRSVREMARKGDLERIKLWVSDAASGAYESAAETMVKLSDRANAAEARLETAVKALEAAHPFLETLHSTTSGSAASSVWRVIKQVRQAFAQPKDIS